MPPKRSYDVAFKISVVEYSKEHSGEQAVHHFKVDPKQVREWHKQYENLKTLNIEKETREKEYCGWCQKSQQ